MADHDSPPAFAPFDRQSLRAYERALGLKRLSLVWAKLEILLGLAAAVWGAVLLRDRAEADVLGGALAVLGIYLAMAGHRSHLYQSANRQAAYLAQLVQRSDRRP